MKSRSWNSRKTIQAVSWIGAGLLIVMILYFRQNNLFRDPSRLQSVLAKTGPFAPLIFILLQIVQVIIPILPGGVSGALGMLCFGTWTGFLYSYIGVILGSLLMFVLVRKFGWPFIESLVKPSTYEKYARYLSNGRHFDAIFALLIFLPIAPDDILCMIAGLTNIKWQKFLLIIMLGKPISSFLYSSLLIWLMQLI